MDAANGKATNWPSCWLLRHSGISRITGNRLRHLDRPAMERARASRFCSETRAASLLVESGALVERKSPGNLLHVLSPGTKPESARPRADRVSDACCANRD